MFLPTTADEIKQLGWDRPDIILISGDTYIDSPFIGISILGHLLMKNGYKTAVIAQPDIHSQKDIMRLGEPKLLWGVTAGSVDSMVANYTASGKFRKSDDYTPGGQNNRRPDRATIKYVNLIRRYFKNTAPVMIGGIEASLRRITHYDFWSNKLRRPILFDSKADYLLYGMSEKSILNLANALTQNIPAENIGGLCYIAKTPRSEYLELPSYEATVADKKQFIQMFRTFYLNNDPLNSKGLCQQVGNRYLIQNPPEQYLTQGELDKVYALPFENDVHPHYAKMGKVRALDTIQFSIPTHRGCYGECNYCAIAVHEGRTVRWRSEESIVKSIDSYAKHNTYKGIIRDLCGPTANMYGFECALKLKQGGCKNKRCMYPKICRQLKPDHSKHLHLIKSVRSHPKVRKAFIGSGIRYDLLTSDEKHFDKYIEEIATHHVSGQLKLAPEHSNIEVLDLMGKPGPDTLLKFKEKFDAINKRIGKKQFLTYYLIAAHPGCDLKEMKQLQQFIGKHLRIKPEQVQIFTPTPSTWSTLMYYTEINPNTGKSIFVEKNPAQKEKQKVIITKSLKTLPLNP